MAGAAQRAVRSVPAVPAGGAAIAKEGRAAAETALFHQLETQADALRESVLAAPEQDGREEELEFVDEPGPERLGGEGGAAHGEVAAGRLFLMPDRDRVEFPLDPRSGREWRLQRPRVHDLPGRLPDRREVPRGR